MKFSNTFSMLTMISLAAVASASDLFKLLDVTADIGANVDLVGLDGDELTLGTKESLSATVGALEISHGKALDTVTGKLLDVSVDGIIYESSNSSADGFVHKAGNLLYQGNPLYACQYEDKYKLSAIACDAGKQVTFELQNIVQQTHSDFQKAVEATKNLGSGATKNLGNNLGNLGGLGNLANVGKRSLEDVADLGNVGNTLNEVGNLGSLDKRSFEVPPGVKDIKSVPAEISEGFATAKNAIESLIGKTESAFGALAVNVGTKFNQVPILKHASSPYTFFAGGDEGDRVFFVLKGDTTLVDQYNRGIGIDAAGFIGNVPPTGRTAPTSGFKIVDGHLTLDGHNFWACPTDGAQQVLSAKHCNQGTPIVLHTIFN